MTESLRDAVRALQCEKLRARGGWAEDAATMRCRFPVAWRNTVSNLAYALAGLWLMATSSDPMRWPMGSALVVLCVGSAGYHGTKTTFWNNMDWAGMYATMAVLVIHGIDPTVPGGLLGGFTIGTVGAMLFAFQVKHFDLLMLVLFVVAAVPPVLRGNLPLVLVCTGIFALAYLCWQLDHRRKLIGLWGHAAWHVLTAVAMALLFLAQALSVHE